MHVNNNEKKLRVHPYIRQPIFALTRPGSGNHSRPPFSCLIDMQSIAGGPSVRATNIRAHGVLPRPSLAHAALRQPIGGLIARPSFARDLLKHQVCNIGQLMAVIVEAVSSVHEHQMLASRSAGSSSHRRRGEAPLL